MSFTLVITGIVRFLAGSAYRASFAAHYRMVGQDEDSSCINRIARLVCTSLDGRISRNVGDASKGGCWCVCTILTPWQL